MIIVLKDGSFTYDEKYLDKAVSVYGVEELSEEVVNELIAKGVFVYEDVS